MKSKETLRTVIIVFICFALYHLLFLSFKPIKLGLDKITHQGLISYILTYFIIGIPVFAGTWLINRGEGIFKSLGLSSGILTAAGVSLLFVLPMFIGGFLFFRLDTQPDVQNLIAGTLVAGFMEELYFRGFLFGQLFQKTRLGFITSVLLGAVIFASGHLYQSRDTGELIGIFMVTFSGAVFFAWLYVEWNYNLWVPILTHTLMNLAWSLFEVDSSALGDIKANIFRGLTILTAIVFTILYKKKQKLVITHQTLLFKRYDPS
ncbi:lysostaphin resistance A-like protein [Leadbetterella sp. DM7]|uniref:CPBP family intramembrane glutamic endopeptidase n=1 Tax=Leadbetterella sp. DM7 TaxID=3235085 RepID=UPI00349E68E9